MFDIGWSELLLIGVVALIVVGPKDLPVMFHSLGRMTAKARAMAREFSRAMEDAAKETGLDAVSKDLKDMTSKKSLGISALERATEKFEKWDPKMPGTAKPAAKPKFEPDPELLAELDAAELAHEAPDTPAAPLSQVVSEQRSAQAETTAAKPKAAKPRTPKTEAKTAAAKAETTKPKTPRKAPAKKAAAPKDDA